MSASVWQLIFKFCVFIYSKTTTWSQVFGKVWTAPLTSFKVEDIVGTIEKELMEKELKLKNQKGKKRAKPSSATAQEPETINVEDGDDVWSIPSEDEVAVSGKSGPKIPKTSSAEKEAAAAARKAANQRTASWKKEVSKASKIMACFNSTTNSLASLLNKVEKRQGVLDDQMVSGLQEANAKILTLKKSI